MKRFCVGVLWIGLACIVAAGCSEASSSPGNDDGRFYGERDATDAEGDRQAASVGDTSSGSTDGKGPAADSSGDANDATTADGGAIRPSAGQSDEKQPVQPAADATSAGSAGGASDGAKPPPREHFAPQQVATGGDGTARNVTFDNLKFEMEDPKSRLFQREMLTDAIEKLSGSRIRIRGFILPGALEEFSNFILVRDNQECCFGPGAALYDSIMVDMTDNQIVKFSTRPVTVEGTFEIKELVGPDNRHWSIYRLTATKVE